MSILSCSSSRPLPSGSELTNEGNSAELISLSKLKTNKAKKVSVNS